MSSHYELQFIRAENVVWASSSRAKPPNLYVKLTLGDTVQKTPVIKRNASPRWTTSFELPAGSDSDVEDLMVELKHKSSLLCKQSVGVAVVNVKKLMEDSANGDVKVELHASGSRRSMQVTGVLFLQMKAAEDRAPTDTVAVPAATTTSPVAVGTEQADQVQVQVKRNSDVTADDGEGFGSMLQAAESSTAVLQTSRTVAASEKVEKAEGLVTENWDLLQSVVELAKQVQPFVTIMDEVASIHPYLNVTWQIVSSLQKVIKKQADDDEAVIGLVRCMKETFESVKSLDSLRNRLKSLNENMVEFFKQSSECCTFIREYTGHGFIRRMLKVGSHDKIQMFRERFNEFKTALTSGTTIHVAFTSARILEVVDLTYLERQLKPTEMDASNRPQCLPGTRSDILNHIMDWIFSDTGKNMLWLHGVAGSGKSTVSTTIAKYCLDMTRQGAHLFFVRGKSKPNHVIRDIAFRLASFDPSIAEHVVAAVKNNNGITEAPLESQFQMLLLQPLQAATDAMTGPVVVVLDALDECGSPDERTRLMKLFGEEFPKLPPVFRFIVTSRPEADLTAAFSTSESVAVVALDYTSKTSKSDVNMYLDVEMRVIFRGQSQHVKLDWRETMDILGNAADGLFIWASTAIKMVKKSDEPAEELEDLVEFCRSRPSGSRAGLVELYDAVLENSGVQWSKPRSRERFAQILGFILFSKAPVTPRTIDGLLGFSSHTMLSRLASVLSFTPGNDDTPVRLFHTSFSDYLLAPERKEQRWFINEPAQRMLLPARCFDVMASKLSFNICRLESSFLPNDKAPDLDARIKERIPSDLQYASQYWAQHLCDVSHAQAPSKLLDQLTVFIQRHLLYWFEVLSLTKQFDRVANRSLYGVSLWSGPDWPNISSLVWSAYRFSSIFSIPMSRSAPHVYISALSLGYQDFRAVEDYSKMLPIMRSHRFGMKPPPPCLKVISEHTGYVRSVAFSPDGRCIASGSDDKTVRVWDVDSGKLVAGPFQGHERGIHSVAFSPDGRRIASGSFDKTVRVWDVDSGKLVSGPFQGHERGIHSVAFSPDGRRIASGSDDETVRVWDVDSGKLVSGPFQGHEDWVNSVAFSPDGRRVASGSGDKTVRVWDVDSGKLVSGPFQGHEGGVSSVAFSPDGRRIASGSYDKTVRVWDVDSGELVSGPSQGGIGSSTVSSPTVLSPDKRLIASGSLDGTIRISHARYPVATAEDAESKVEDVGKSERDSRGSHELAAQQKEPQEILEEICRNPRWKISRDGWLLGKSGELIIWIPEDMRRTLWSPATTAIASCAFSTKLDIMSARLGEGWYEGYPKTLPE